MYLKCAKNTTRTLGGLAFNIKNNRNYMLSYTKKE